MLKFHRNLSPVPVPSMLALVLVTLAGCAQPAAPPVASVAVGPIPPGQARIWFYRDYEPYVSRATANVELNGAVAAYVSTDANASYRDVPPGHYHVAAQGLVVGQNQAKDIDLAPGQEVFAKVDSLRGWAPEGDLGGNIPEVFYITLVPAERARVTIAPYRFGGGG